VREHHFSRLDTGFVGERKASKRPQRVSPLELLKFVTFHIERSSPMRNMGDVDWEVLDTKVSDIFPEFWSPTVGEAGLFNGRVKRGTTNKKLTSGDFLPVRASLGGNYTP
jgi:hypothetical protein